MCLIAFALHQHERYPFILIANRDEFYERSTSAAHWWEQGGFYAGKDLKAGGTWMATSPRARFAAITNYRDPDNINPNARSRGDIPVNFFSEGRIPTTYLEEVDKTADEYNGFNLLLSDFDKMWHYSNYEKKINLFEKGVHGLSNALMNSEWPKVRKIKAEFSNIISGHFDAEDLFDLLGDPSLAPRDLLPHTGISPEWEEALSAICIKTEKYGTCSSSVILMDSDRQVTFIEKVYPVGRRKEQPIEFNFTLK